MNDIAYYNGKFAPMDEMAIPINDRGVYFGDGVYEVVYARNKKVFALDEHMQRLGESLEATEIAWPMSDAQIRDVIYEAVSRVDAIELFVYFQVTRGTYPRIHHYPPKDVKSNFLLFSRPGGLQDVLNKDCTLCTMEDIRWGRCDIKSLNLLPNTMAAEYANSKGCHEAVLLRGDKVSECSRSSICILKGGTLYTAPVSFNILHSVTRLHFIELAKKLNKPVREEVFTLNDMMTADEVIVVSTSTQGMRVTAIDEKPVGGKDGETLRALQLACIEKINGQVGPL